VTIPTRLTERFDIKHPIVVASMTPASAGTLVSAVAAAGGLGLLGGGYVDRAWFEAESAKVTRLDVGAAFITWSIPDDPGLLDIALERHPRAMMLSFSNPGPYAARIKKAGAPLICQVHTLDHAFQAVDAGAEMVVAQGAEAGGHGLALRSTMPFVPSVVDALATRAPDVLVLAAGAITDGRSLAASLMLGADGVLMDTTFLATREARFPDAAKVKAMAASLWPPSHTGRIMRNDLVEKWSGYERKLEGVRTDEVGTIGRALQIDDVETANLIPTAGDLINRIVAEASRMLMKFTPTPGARPMADAERPFRLGSQQ
jgi:nitronate monooxygenase